MLSFFIKFKTYILWFVFSIIFLIILLFYQPGVAKILQNSAIEKNSVFVNLYQKNVFDKYFLSIDKLVFMDSVKWKNDLNFVKFASDSFEFMNSLDAVTINVYNKNGDKLISTNKNVIEKHVGNQDLDLILAHLLSYLKKEKSVNMLLYALKGNNISKILTSVTYKDKDNFVKKGTIVDMYLPLLDMNNEIIGVVEIYEDVSNKWQKVAEVKLFILTVIALFLIIFYSRVLLNQNKIKKIIEIKKEENIKLIASKNIAEEENEKKSYFLSNLANELKMQINIMITLLGSSKIDDITEHGKYLLDLVSDIESYSKAENEDLKIEFTLIDVKKVIHSSINLVKHYAQESAITINEDFDNENIVILADQTKLTKALVLILSNAIKYTPPGGKIMVFANIEINENNESFVHIAVEDNGSGINIKEHENKIYYHETLQDNKNKFSPNIGLGIPFAKELIKLMNGEIFIESKLGVGTKVTFVFEASE